MDIDWAIINRTTCQGEGINNKTLLRAYFIIFQTSFCLQDKIIDNHNHLYEMSEWYGGEKGGVKLSVHLQQKWNSYNIYEGYYQHLK